MIQQLVKFYTIEKENDFWDLNVSYDETNTKCWLPDLDNEPFAILADGDKMDVPWNSIVFIQDTRKIYHNLNFYGNTEFLAPYKDNTDLIELNLNNPDTAIMSFNENGYQDFLLKPGANLYLLVEDFDIRSSRVDKSICMGFGVNEYIQGFYILGDEYRFTNNSVIFNHPLQINKVLTNSYNTYEYPDLNTEISYTLYSSKDYIPTGEIILSISNDELSCFYIKWISLYEGSNKYYFIINAFTNRLPIVKDLYFELYDNGFILSFTPYWYNDMGPILKVTTNIAEQKYFPMYASPLQGTSMNNGQLTEFDINFHGWGINTAVKHSDWL